MLPISTNYSVNKLILSDSSLNVENPIGDRGERIGGRINNAMTVLGLNRSSSKHK